MSSRYHSVGPILYTRGLLRTIRVRNERRACQGVSPFLSAFMKILECRGSNMARERASCVHVVVHEAINVIREDKFEVWRHATLQGLVLYSALQYWMDVYLV